VSMALGIIMGVTQNAQHRSPKNTQAGVKKNAVPLQRLKKRMSPNLTPSQQKIVTKAFAIIGMVGGRRNTEAQTAQRKKSIWKARAARRQEMQKTA